MSTFDGKVAEFPDIRIDYFRVDPHARPPLAYFLSHVHSDHLDGLESCKSPFIYCSPATRDILLRLEKYPHRMNFSRGILETRKQTYRHLRLLLKAIPLETPTEIELSPDNKVRVTLFDANHCVGAVMLLLEGGGKAVLYTGDVRSELWWVNSLTRHPVLLPYACSQGTEANKRLDCIYLDTTFVVTGREDPYTKFPSKAEGIAELLQEVAKYPTDTVFYIDAWTFGYEDVWQALSVYLGSQIHVDDYRWGMYRALAQNTEPRAPEAVKLIGFRCGNHFQQGCLSPDACRLHSCEKGTGCEVWNQDFVRITPIVSRYNGVELAELGTGGGHGDLTQQHQLEIWDPELVSKLMILCTKKLQGESQALERIVNRLTSAMKEGAETLSLDDFSLLLNNGVQRQHSQEAADFDDLPLDKLVPALVRSVIQFNAGTDSKGQRRGTRTSASGPRPDGLPQQITFPYSRHSSYDELRLLIEAFKPRNIFPCTVDKRNWSPASSMASLFGHVYNETLAFSHDDMMLKKRGAYPDVEKAPQRPASSSSDDCSYATPTGRNGLQKRQSNPMQTQPADARQERRQSEDVRRVSNRSMGRAGKQAQGDFRPPLDVDHYSPSRESSRPRTAPTRIMSSGHEENEVELERTEWPNLARLESPPKSPLRNRWLKRIATAVESNSKDGEWTTDRPQKRHRQSEEYGRLTPPTGIDDARIRQRTDEMDSDVGSNHSVSGPMTLAFRKEVYDAIKGGGELTWPEIGLPFGTPEIAMQGYVRLRVLKLHYKNEPSIPSFVNSSYNPQKNERFKMEFVMGLGLALPITSATGVSVVTGVAQGVSEQKKQNADASNQGRMLKFHIDVCVDPASRKGKGPDLNNTIITLQKDKVWAEAKSPITRLPEDVSHHPFTGFYLAYPDDDRPYTRGLVSTISVDPPILNWIYIDKDTLELKYASRSGSIAHHVGSFDWTSEDSNDSCITFDEWEGFMAVEEEPGQWALYFDLNDDGLKQHKKGRKTVEVSLQRRVISEQETNKWGLAGEGNIGFKKTREV